MLGDWHEIIRLDERSALVTAADIQRVARKYLTSDNMTVGWLVKP